jgi:hypothetical protein
VVVLDIAFAAEGTGASFEKVTGPFIQKLGPRLKRWVDHHDHAFHARYAHDPRFVLSTKAQHGACPEMLTPELVRATGPVDTLVCHADFDGLFAAARWLRGGLDPYPGAEDDARAVDTRLGEPSAVGLEIDHALRLRGRDEGFLVRLVAHLAEGLGDAVVAGEVREAAAAYAPLAARTEAVAHERYKLRGATALCDLGAESVHTLDKTWLLLLGQRRARVSVVCDRETVTLAAAFDSGLDFLAMLGIQGGMPTVVSVPRARMAEVLDALGARGLYDPSAEG